MVKPKTVFSRFKSYVKTIDRAWLKTWIAIYVGFLILDAFSHLRYGDATIIQDWQIFSLKLSVPVIYGGTFIGTTILKYLGILLNFIYAHIKFRDDHLLQIALGFTLLADTILCLHSTSPFGVLIFCLAQYFHTARLAKTSPKFFIVYGFIIFAFLLIGYQTGIPSIFTVGGAYATLLLTNFCLSARWFRSTREQLMQKRASNASENPASLETTPAQHSPKKSAALNREIIASTCAYSGFTLFLCCDTCVATSFLSLIGFLPFFLYAPANFLSWGFYYISQLLIANSSTLVTTPPKQNSTFFAQK